jgi:hypothetical protein
MLALMNFNQNSNQDFNNFEKNFETKAGVDDLNFVAKIDSPLLSLTITHLLSEAFINFGNIC